MCTSAVADEGFRGMKTITLTEGISVHVDNVHPVVDEALSLHRLTGPGNK